MILQPTLVLNASYEAVNIVPMRRALTLVFNGLAIVEDICADQVVRTSRATFPAPSVIRLLRYRKIPKQIRALSRKTILMRDMYSCQYCHKTLAPGLLTLDHVQPRSRSGASTWENLVAACFACNNRKGDRTPDEAGMPLDRVPRPFSLHTSRHLIRMSGERENSWKQYLFY